MTASGISNREIARFGECACFNLRRLSRLVTQRYERRLRSTGLRITQLPIMARLAAGPAKMGVLSRWLAMERTALLRTVQPLIDEGYVAVAPAEEGRGVQYELTGTGRKRLAELRPSWEAAHNEVVAMLGGEKWAALLDGLSTAADRLAKN
jgi:DNA-binding MarR family transcriptional regulator